MTVADGHVELVPTVGRVTDVAVCLQLRVGAPDGLPSAATARRPRLVALTQERDILVFSVARAGCSWSQPTSMRESEPVTSLQLAPDGRYALVSVPQAIHMWDLDGRRLVRAFRGQRQSRFVIRTAFGGAAAAFVASGSEDSMVYVWQRNSGALLAELGGHSGVVNAVSWNPRFGAMMASASDDGTVRLWLPPDGTCSLLPDVLVDAPMGDDAQS